MANPKNGMIIIPAYREAGRIEAVVKAVACYGLPVTVVDDGSPDATAEVARQAGASVILHSENRGKGAALESGFDYAREVGCEFVITMDADGQHAPEDIGAFLAAYAEGDFPVLIGNRMDNPATMPLVRRWTNWYMSALLSRKMGQKVPDTQNGYRLYRLDVLPELVSGEMRFAAESEVLLALARKGVRMGAVPVQVIYGDEKSKINPWRDTLRFFKMLRAFDREVNKGV